MSGVRLQSEDMCGSPAADYVYDPPPYLHSTILTGLVSPLLPQLLYTPIPLGLGWGFAHEETQCLLQGLLLPDTLFSRSVDSPEPLPQYEQRCEVGHVASQHSRAKLSKAFRALHSFFHAKSSHGNSMKDLHASANHHVSLHLRHGQS